MNKALLLSFIVIVNTKAYFQKATEVYDSQKIVNQAISDITSIGLNCADPTRLQKNYQEFIEYTMGLFRGIAKFSSSAVYLTLGNSVYPNFCHVYHSGHINSYNEGILERAGEYSGLPATITLPHPEYYWPKYLIEVTESGNENHKSFVFKNPLWVAQRNITNGILESKSLNVVDGLSLSMLGGSQGDVVGGPIQSVLRNQRITGAIDKDFQSFEASIWPVALSHEIAKEFSVCGKEREKYGLNAGGVKWKVPVVPMTCSLATSRQIGFMWDMGLIDLVNPASIKKVAIGSNPKTCALEYTAKMAAKLAASEARSITQAGEAMLNKLKAPFDLRKALLGCGFPPIGEAESFFNTIKDFARTDKLFELSCSPWGGIFPRTSKEYTTSEFKFINTALKFKSVSNEVLGVDRGDLEKWTTVYPRDTRSSSLYHTGDPRMIDKVIGPSGNAYEVKDITTSMTKSNLLKQMSPEIALAYMAKKEKAMNSGQFATGSTKRRIYLISEKIKCVFPSKKIKVKLPGGGGFEKYDSCKSAIKLKVNKYFQQVALRKICDASGMIEGLPWKL